MAFVESVNVGRPREVVLRDEVVLTAIGKAAVVGRVAVRGVNVEGDEQADLKVHGGPDKAVYAYAAEDYDWWAGELGRELAPGTFGDNLTLRGADVTNAVIGERWRVGSTVLEVCQPRIPCFKLGLRMRDPRFPTSFAAAARPGAYLRIVAEGDVAAGHDVEVLERPDHGVTIGAVERAYHARLDPTPLLAAPQLPRGWRRWAEQRLARR